MVLDALYLNEYEAAELQAADEAFRAVLDRIDAHRATSVAFLDFFPEYENHLEGKVYTNSLMQQIWGAELFRSSYRDLKSVLPNLPELVEPSVSIGEAQLMQLPFFDVVISPLKPLGLGEDFKGTHGIDPDNFADLASCGRIIPILMDDPLEYANSDPLQPMLEMTPRPPCYTIRMQYYLTAQLYAIVSKQVDVSPIVRLFPELSTRDVEALLRDFSEARSREDFKRRLYSTMSQRAFLVEILIALGYGDLVVEAQRYLEKYRGYFDRLEPTMAPKLEKGVLWQLAWLGILQLYSETLFALPSLSFGGTSSLLGPVADAYKTVPVLRESFSKLFPLDIARILVKEFELYDFRDLGYRKILSLSQQTGKARKALFELDKAVKDRKPEKIPDRAVTAQERIQETNEIVDSMLHKREKIVRVIPLMLGVAGGIVGSLGGLPSLLAGAGAGAIGGLQTDVSGKIANALLRTRQDSHVLAMYDLAQSVRRRQ